MLRSPVVTRASTGTQTPPVLPVAEPLPPLEDPDLVGAEAARAARERRLCVQRRGEDAEALRQENASWDFMLSQMADWQGRERSWERFRSSVVKQGKVSRVPRMFKLR